MTTAHWITNKTTLMIKRLFLWLSPCVWLIAACNPNSVVDIAQSMEKNQWMYANSVRAEAEITDTTATYNANFKLRINNQYRYSNLFVLVTFQEGNIKKRVRYQFKLATPEGQWLGKGSGEIFTYTFPILKQHQFNAPTKYAINIEQNMRDNPLTGISDVGIEVIKN